MREFNRRLPRATLVLVALTVFAPALLAAEPAKPTAGPGDQYKVLLEVRPTDPNAAKIVFIAGAPSLSVPSREHEWFAGSAVLAKLAGQTPGVAPVLVKDGWPKDPDTLKGAKAVVFYMEGGGKQTVLQHMDEVQKMVDAGVGIVHLHQVIDYPSDSGKQVMTWLGGVYDAKAGGARGHWPEEFTTFPEHPITRGVEPFTIRDGWILKSQFVPDLKGVTPLMRTKQASPTAPKPGDKPLGANDTLVCWAYDRPNGGRSFVFTGGHEHKYWGLPGLRRLVVNGILWSAKIDVPPGGAPVALAESELDANLDPKPQKPAKAASTVTPVK